MSTSVEFRDVSRRYGNSFYAVRNVSLKVSPGEFTTLLGPSGSGKSTLLKLLAGFDDPTSGDVLIDGQSVLTSPPHRRGIGMVFQNYALFPHMSVVENIAFPLRVRKTPEAEIKRRVADVLGITHLEAFSQRFPRELSGGQQQRVALARAIVFDPQVLLMDEPLGALDRNLREQLKAEIKRIQQRFKMTVLFVTHDQDEALVLSDRVVVMRDGMVEQISAPRELYRRPKNAFVARFVGESNLLECRLKNGVIEHKRRRIDVQVAAAPDGPCWLLVRPELVRVSASGQPGVLDGTVREAIFLGEATRLVVDVAGVEVVAKIPNGASSIPEVGDKVTISWPTDAGVVLPFEEKRIAPRSDAQHEAAIQ